MENKSVRRVRVDSLSEAIKNQLAMDAVTCRIPRKGNKVWFSLYHSELPTVKAPIAKKVIFNKGVDFKDTIIETVAWVLMATIKETIKETVAGVVNGNA